MSEVAEGDAALVIVVVRIVEVAMFPEISDCAVRDLLRLETIVVLFLLRTGFGEWRGAVFAGCLDAALRCMLHRAIFVD